MRDGKFQSEVQKGRSEEAAEGVRTVECQEEADRRGRFDTGNSGCGIRHILSSDEIISVLYTTTGPVTLTLPEISTVGKVKYVIKDEGSNSCVNNITINTTGSDTIEGETNAIIDFDKSSWSLYNDDNTGWFIE